MEKLSEEQIQEFKEAFEIFDADQSGTISTAELKEVMKKLGQNPTDKEIDEMMREVDEDGSGEIDIDEFLLLMGKQLEAEENEQLSELKEDAIEAFKGWDAEEKGYITAQDLKSLLGKISEHLSRKEIGLIVDEADTHKTGNIDYEEFVKHMLKR